jgi:hypothetical protein
LKVSASLTEIKEIKREIEKNLKEKKPVFDIEKILKDQEKEKEKIDANLLFIPTYTVTLLTVLVQQHTL